MKKKLKVLIGTITCAVIVLFAFGITACSSLVFSGQTLISGKVGVEYVAYVGFATGADEITYELKEGSVLPSGLELSADGFIEGIPTQKTAGEEKFIVTAIANGNTIDAEFSINIEKGVLAYEGREIKAAKGQNFEIDLTMAEATLSLSYKVTTGELPTDVSLSEDGVLSGKVSKLTSIQFGVTASAADCDSSEANFTLNVVDPWLDYDQTAIQKGNVGVYYTTSVASATNASDISYALSENSTLPDGLKLDAIGMIYGVPTVEAKSSFTVVASAKGYTQAEMDFNIQIRSASLTPSTSGTISFKITDFETKLYIQNNQYIDMGIVSASATNRAKVTYEVTEGALPDGLSLYPNGTVAGTATAAKETTFTVTANAVNCESVSKQFTIEVLRPQITYRGVDYSADSAHDLVVGQSCNVQLNTATLPGDLGSDGITYEATSKLPEGLSISKEGILTGTPQKSFEYVQVSVRASASGFTARATTFTFHIADAIVSGVTRFEAELTDLRGLVGSGYSGSAPGSNMIQSFAGVLASTNGEIKAGGFFVGYTYNPIVHKFNFNSSAAVSSATLAISLDSEKGPMSLSPSLLDIKVNGVSVSYSASVTASSSSKFTEFKAYNLGNVQLKEGENIITVSVMTTTIGGLGIDYIELGNLTGANLSWRPANYNLNNK